MNKPLLLVSLLSFLIIVIFSNQNVHPDQGLRYPLKRLAEKISISVIPTSTQKAKFYTYLLGVRMEEVNYVVTNKKDSYIETSTHRYAATAGQLSRLVSSSRLTPDQIQQLFTRHQARLSSLRDTYPSPDSAGWRLLQDDVNYLTLYSRELNKD